MRSATQAWRVRPPIAFGRTGRIALGFVIATTALAVAPSPLSVRAQTDSATPEHSLTVTGTGRVTTTPDVAYTAIGVTVRQDQAQDASAAAAAAMTDVVGALRSQGIADEDMQTVTLSLQPHYNYRRSSRK